MWVHAVSRVAPARGTVLWYVSPRGVEFEQTFDYGRPPIYPGDLDMTMTLPVMSDRHAPITQFPQHANVMALVKAFEEPVPWALLLEVVTRLQRSAPEVALGEIPLSRIDAALLDVVTDLRSLGLLDVRPVGTVFTDAGEDTIREWNGQFTERLAAAKAALLTLGITV